MEEEDEQEDEKEKEDCTTEPPNFLRGGGGGGGILSSKTLRAALQPLTCSAPSPGEGLDVELEDFRREDHRSDSLDDGYPDEDNRNEEEREEGGEEEVSQERKDGTTERNGRGEEEGRDEEGKMMKKGSKARWGMLAKRVLAPSWTCATTVLMCAGIWTYIIIGAAIIRAIDASTRNDQDEGGQTSLSFIDAVYFTETWVSSCGHGDIVAVSDDSRAFLFVWSFFGNSVWLVVNMLMATSLYGWFVFGFVLYPWWLLRGRNPQRKERRAQKDNMFGWRMLLSSVLASLLVWVAFHLLGAGVFYVVEPQLSNLEGNESLDFGEAFYFAMISSQTICFGDYTVKTQEGRVFYLLWHQPTIVSAYYLFTSVTLIVLKWTNSRIMEVLLFMVARRRSQREESKTSTRTNDNTAPQRSVSANVAL